MSNSVLTPQVAPRKGDLTALANRIDDLHDRVTEAALKTVEHARECGELLNQVKDQVGHGHFQPWLGANCRVKLRQAQKYMRLAREWPAIEAKSASNAPLTIDGALRLLDSGETQTQHEPAEISAGDPFDHDADPFADGWDGVDRRTDTDGTDSEEPPPRTSRNGTEEPEGEEELDPKELFQNQKAKTVKTIEALMRAIDDLKRLRELPQHAAMIKGLEKMLATVKALK